MKKKLKFISKVKIFTLRNFKNFIFRPNKNATWVFGFQKSGTSVIAALLGIMSNKSTTIDTIYLWKPYLTELNKVGIKRHLNKYSYDFSKDIIKEPNATAIISTIESYFYMRKFVFITRNPYDNIRSILNRLDLPGHLSEINYEDINIKWRGKFKSGGQNYVRDLAESWVEANSNYEYMYDKRCVLVKYEDFVEDKKIFTEKMTQKLGFTIVNDITHVMDKSFQPKGNPNTNIIEFFGETNINIINNVCNDVMKKLGYKQLNYSKSLSNLTINN